MGSAPMYNLTWGEYGTSLISAVQLLRCHGELVDVTLAAGGRTFHAHKVVLCAASPFLLDLLKSTTCKHPVVMLAGVQASDLEALLEFVYRGEVSIDQNQLPSLLQAAHCLSIQGLTPSPTSINHEPMHRQSLKSASEVSKIEPLESETAINASQADEELPVKKKRRTKRMQSPSSIQTEKLFIQTTNINDNVQDVSNNANATLWTQQMNIINVGTSTMDTLPNQPSLSVHNVATPLNNSSEQPTVVHVTTTKMKGASDQPGACPLCGAMLRQARNLRRHLVTSCKYRMLNGVAQNSNLTTVQSGRELMQLHAVPVQNVERVMQTSMEHLDSKPLVLTPISCTEIISPNANIITVTSSTVQ